MVGHQSLSTEAPDEIAQFKHQFSLLSSKSDKQRREALSYLTTRLSQDSFRTPVGTQAMLSRSLPLISDSSTPVRAQLIKLLRALPASEVKNSAPQVIMYVRAGLTHLSADISNDALGVMEWLLEVAGDHLASCPGGWVKTLNTFCALMGWSLSTPKSSWSSAPRAGIRAKHGQNYQRQITILGKFLRTGFQSEDSAVDTAALAFDYLEKLPRDPDAFAYLNLTGPTRDEEGEMYLDRESRQQVFHKKFLDAFRQGVEQAKKEAGMVGRAAAGLDQILSTAMDDFEPSAAISSQDLLELW